MTDWTKLLNEWQNEILNKLQTKIEKERHLVSYDERPVTRSDLDYLETMIGYKLIYLGVVILFGLTVMFSALVSALKWW